MILYTLKSNKLIKAATVYTGISIFFALFGAIYEHYSHEVYSYYMIYAFAIPLICGTFLCLVLYFSKLKEPESKTANLYNSGIACLTVGSVMKGVLVIYGTTNRLMNVYPLVGIALIVLSIISFYYDQKK